MHPFSNLKNTPGKKYETTPSAKTALTPLQGPDLETASNTRYAYLLNTRYFNHLPLSTNAPEKERLEKNITETLYFIQKYTGAILDKRMFIKAIMGYLPMLLEEISYENRKLSIIEQEVLWSIQHYGFAFSLVTPVDLNHLYTVSYSFYSQQQHTLFAKYPYGYHCPHLSILKLQESYGDALNPADIPIICLLNADVFFCALFGNLVLLQKTLAAASSAKSIRFSSGYNNTLLLTLSVAIEASHIEIAKFIIENNRHARCHINNQLPTFCKKWLTIAIHNNDLAMLTFLFHAFQSHFDKAFIVLSFRLAVTEKKPDIINWFLNHAQNKTISNAIKAFSKKIIKKTLQEKNVQTLNVALNAFGSYFDEKALISALQPVMAPDFAKEKKDLDLRMHMFLWSRNQSCFSTEEISPATIRMILEQQNMTWTVMHIAIFHKILSTLDSKKKISHFFSKEKFFQIHFLMRSLEWAISVQNPVVSSALFCEIQEYLTKKQDFPQEISSKIKAHIEWLFEWLRNTHNNQISELEKALLEALEPSFLSKTSMCNILDPLENEKIEYMTALYQKFGIISFTQFYTLIETSVPSFEEYDYTEIINELKRDTFDDETFYPETKQRKLR